MFWRSFCLAMTLALSAGADEVAYKTRVSGPEGVVLDVGPFAASTSIEDVLAQLNHELIHYDNSGLTIREGMVRRGEEIATRIVPYDRAVRLTNDVSRSGALGGQMIILAAGTPLYVREFLNADMVMANGRSRVRPLWCGANGAKGYCLIQRASGWEGTEIRSDSPFLPASLGPFVPVSAPVLVEDPTAKAELPTRTEIYRLGAMRGANAVVSRSVRVGDQDIEFGDARTGRMRLGSLIVRISPASEADAATVEATPINPADYENEMRRLARFLAASAD